MLAKNGLRFTQFYNIAKYRGKFKVGWDVIRKQRFQRMKKMGIIGPDHKLTPHAHQRSFG